MWNYQKKQPIRTRLIDGLKLAAALLALFLLILAFSALANSAGLISP